MPSTQKLGGVYLVKQMPEAGETAREAFPCNVLKYAISSLPFKTSPHFQYNHARLFIQAGLLKTDQPTVDTRVSETKRLIFQSYVFNPTVERLLCAQFLM